MKIIINGDVHITNILDTQEEQEVLEPLMEFNPEIEFDEDFLQFCIDQEEINNKELQGNLEEVLDEYEECVDLLERCDHAEDEKIDELLDLIGGYSEYLADINCEGCIKEEIMDLFHEFLDIIEL